MDILELITDKVNDKNTLKKLGASVDADPAKVKNLASLAMPALLQALTDNANTPEGAQSLSNALEQHKDDDVDDVEGFLDKVDIEDGAKILEHILEGKNKKVQNNLSKKTGLSKEQVSGLLVQLAPLLLGTFGQQKKKKKFDSSQIAGFLGDLLGQGKKNGVLEVIADLFDGDDDDNDNKKDDVLGDVVGDLLGGLFKK